ncbi:NAD(P)-binding protein [Penicillium canescens]|nr:NAD(P)-binding protein [Penicillium canescens]
MVDTTNLPAQRLANKVGVVTGAASGIDRAISLLYALHGAKLVCADPTYALILTPNGRAVFLQCDVTKAAKVETLVAELVKLYGQQDMGVAEIISS